jgi:hypothetical protein
MVALLGVVGWLSNIGHLTFVSHAVCAAHGELVHGHLSHEQTPPPSALGADDGSKAPDLATADAANDHGHGHCATSLHQACAAAWPIPIAPTMLTWPIAVSSLVLENATNTARYRFAPKTSPPQLG